MLYKKQNAKIMYVNKQLNHPKNIIKQIQNITNQPLNKRSSTEEKFLKIKDDYETIMWKCGYDNKLKFEKPEQQPKTNQKHKRKKNVILYNPPFSNSVKTNIGKQFVWTKISDNFDMAVGFLWTI